MLSACPGLPAVVASADFSFVSERVIDNGVLEELCGDSAYPSGTDDWLDRQKRRKKALSPYLDKPLTCVFIRLPGVHYTIEIDPELERVIYWEWQPV